MEAGSFAILTYGCQMNKYDSERIAGILDKLQYKKTDDLVKADLILLNTCTVREKADQKVFSKLGRLKKLKKKNPNLLIGVCGCIPQAQGEKVMGRSPLVDLVFGTQNIHQLPEMITELKAGKKKLTRILEATPDGIDPAEDPFLRESEKQGWVSIMTGCDNFCSYCIVPYTRGRERSRQPNDILNEIGSLAKKGYMEVTLLGQNVNSYGRDLSDPLGFPKLLEEVNSIQGLERIRFVTSHPKDLSDELIEKMQKLDKVCESLHLPLQSGSDKILEKMNRLYTNHQYMEIVGKLKKAIPGITLSTDIIVGFPGESDDDFSKTEQAMLHVGFDSSFIFKYSPRTGTAAASFKDLVDEKLVSERFGRLESIQKETTFKNNKLLEGKSVEVLVEGESKTNPEKLMGRTRSNKIIIFEGPEKLKGSLVEVEITRAGLYSLDGHMVGSPN